MSARCPICGKPSLPQMRPFCSRRCADVDLARWLRGDYRLPGEPADMESGPAADDGGLPLDTSPRDR